VVNWPSLFSVTLFVSLVPRVNHILGLRNGARHGIGYALAGIAGRLSAFTALIGLTVAGIGAALVAFPASLAIVKWVSVGHLGWTAAKNLQHIWINRSRDSGVDVPERPRLRSAIADEFLIAIISPEPILLFSVLVPRFSRPGGNIKLQLVLGVTFLALELLVGVGYVAAGRGLAAIGSRPRVERRLALSTGVYFLALAGFVAAETI
jgi:homoserine/homoserine lactone efflux protein